MKIFLIFIPLLFSLSSFSQLQYVNGNLSTGAVSNSGVTAPTGYTWSELQSNVGEPTVTNTQEGYPIDYGVNLRHLLADDFIVPTGQTWNISSFEFYVFCDGAVTLPVTELGIEIWNGDPSLGLSTKLYGNVTNNTLDVVNSGDALMYSIRNTGYNSGGLGSGPASLNKKYGKLEVILMLRLILEPIGFFFNQDIIPLHIHQLLPLIDTHIQEAILPIVVQGFIKTLQAKRDGLMEWMEV